MFTPQDHTFAICAYKDNPHLQETIDSLKGQTDPSNILLSTSTPSEFIEGICRKNDIEMHVNPTPGKAGDDWNYAFSCAKTPLVTLAHQDDFYEPIFTERTLAYANSNPGKTIILFTDYYEIRDGSKVMSNRLLKIKRKMLAPLRTRIGRNSKFIRSRILSFGDPICCPATTYVAASVGQNFFDTTYINSCDYKTFVDLSKLEGAFVYIPEPLLGHRIYAGSATSKNLADNIRKGEDAEILDEFWPKPFVKAINHFYAKSEDSNNL